MKTVFTTLRQLPDFCFVLVVVKEITTQREQLVFDLIAVDRVSITLIYVHECLLKDFV